MKTAILIYLAIGILLNIFGPLAKKTNEEIIKIKKPSLADIILERKSVPKWKKILFELILRLLCVTFYPILYLIIAIDFFRSKSLNNEIESNVSDNLLYFVNMGGAGKISCNVCDFNQEIVSFLHGHGLNSWNNSGFQCQKCGKFHQIEYDMNNSKGKKCECGGILDREKPLFCPKCKTNNITYNMSYIT